MSKRDINIAQDEQTEADVIQSEHSIHSSNGKMHKKSVTTTFESTMPSTSDSVELKKGTKGVVWSIKCYGTMPEAYERAKQLYQQCEEQYGMGDAE